MFGTHEYADTQIQTFMKSGGFINRSNRSFMNIVFAIPALQHFEMRPAWMASNSDLSR